MVAYCGSLEIKKNYFTLVLPAMITLTLLTQNTRTHEPARFLYTCCLGKIINIDEQASYPPLILLGARCVQLPTRGGELDCRRLYQKRENFGVTCRSISTPL